MAVVIDFDAPRRLVEVEQVGEFAAQPGLAAALRQSPVELLSGVAHRLFEQALAVAALRHADLDLAPGDCTERLGEQIGLVGFAVDQDQLRRRHAFVELHQEAFEHLALGHARDMGRKEAAVPPILPAANEETGDAELPALGRQGKDVGVTQPVGVDRLRPLDEGQRLQPVAQHRRLLEIHRVGGFGHRVAEPLLHRGRAAFEEVLRVAHQPGIVRLRYAIDAGRRAAPDLVEQARPRPVRKEAVGAASEQEGLLQRVERPTHRARAREGAVIAPLGAPRAAMLLNAREIMVGAQQDEGEAFIVAEQDVVRRAVTLDELRLEQQRLGLAVRRDDLHRARLRDHALQPLRQARDLGVIGDAVFQRPRLADVQHLAARIEHPVDAGAYRQLFDDAADRFGAALQVGPVGPLALAADDIGRLLFVESVGSVRTNHDFACRRGRCEPP